ncbi:UNVERIFIED_CONTAM: hypothetical protein PYX00_002961 [Menopon gallinae]|uniref:Serine protease HTRA2, mitochondrial n=1 Tax=Menopon gallinae TaxID=328185 RepID=A0AAW2HYJ9_9NEOP
MASKIFGREIVRFFRRKTNQICPCSRSTTYGDPKKISSLGKGTACAVGVAALWYTLPDAFPLVRADSEPPSRPPLSQRHRFNFISDVVEKVAKSVVYIEVKNSRFFNIVPPNGSGFIVGEDGLILTNAHVVLNKLNNVVQVKLTDGRTFLGTVEDIDLKLDLATIRINAKNLPTVRLGTCVDAKPGEWVVAIGSPLTLSNTITSGVISSVSRRSAELGLRNRQIDYIQTDASITFGNSGGPLVNLDAEVIGINCMKITGGISFAIPIDYAKEFLSRSLDKSQATAVRPDRAKYTGITMFSLSPQVLQELRFGDYQMPGDITSGLFVGSVVLGSPGHLSGLKSGDLVTHIDSAVVQGIDHMYRALEKGGPLKVTILRKGIYLDLILVPEDV